MKPITVAILESWKPSSYYAKLLLGALKAPIKIKGKAGILLDLS